MNQYLFIEPQEEPSEAKQKLLAKEQRACAQELVANIQQLLSNINELDMSADAKDEYRQRLEGVLAKVQKGIVSYDEECPQE